MILVLGPITRRPLLLILPEVEYPRGSLTRYAIPTGLIAFYHRHSILLC